MLRCPLTNPKFKALDTAAVIFGDVFRVALGQKGDLLLNLTDVFLRVLEVDLLDRNDFLGYIVDTSRIECSMVEKALVTAIDQYLPEEGLLVTGDESDIETIGCAQGGKVSMSVSASVAVCVRGNKFECLRVCVYHIDGMFFGQ